MTSAVSPSPDSPAPSSAAPHPLPLAQIPCSYLLPSSRMYHAGVVYLNDTDILLVVILLPILTTMGFCVIQLLVSFLITPEISFALICVCLVLSAYYTAFWLPASFTMWLRTSYIDSMGLNPASGFLIGFAVIFLVLYGGRDYFQRKDVVSG